MALELHLPDIANALNIIGRAANPYLEVLFQGPELSQVGQVRDRLEAWVKEKAPPPEEVEPPAPPEAETAETVEAVEVNPEG